MAGQLFRTTECPFQNAFRNLLEISKRGMECGGAVVKQSIWSETFVSEALPDGWPAVSKNVSPLKFYDKSIHVVKDLQIWHGMRTRRSETQFVARHSMWNGMHEHARGIMRQADGAPGRTMSANSV